VKHTILPTIGEDGRPILNDPKAPRNVAQRSSDKQFKALRKKQRGHLIEQNLDKLEAIDAEYDLLEKQLIDSGLSTDIDDGGYPLNDTFIQDQTQDMVLTQRTETVSHPEDVVHYDEFATETISIITRVRV
tara:strand:+ start:28 stop:420 length:393 start_codon:yes stop_codon:yes gene_type:complete